MVTKTRSPLRIEDRPAIALNRDRSSCETLRRRSPKSDDKPWTYGLDFVKEPSPANLNFGPRWGAYGTVAYRAPRI